MVRQSNAYLSPAAIILGIAAHDIFSSVLLLQSKASDANRTMIWRVAVLSWMFLFGFFICQVMVVDWLTSPYVVPNYWFGLMQLLNYLFNFLTTLGVGTMFLLRIRVFYGNRSKTYLAMLGLFALVVIFKGLGDAFGMYVAYDVMKLRYLNYELHPRFLDIPRFMAVAHVAEAAFASVGSISFLYALGKGLGKSSEQIVYDIVLKHDGLRLLGIIGVDLLIAIFGVYNVLWETTFVTHVVFYLPTWAYAMQFGTFLQHSYIEARQIIEEHTSSVKNSQNRSQIASGKFPEKQSYNNLSTSSSGGYQAGYQTPVQYVSTPVYAKKYTTVQMETANPSTGYSASVIQDYYTSR
jgi:hypothetical protein